MLGDFFSWLEGLSGHTWFLAIILLIALADSVIPVVPSESMVIIGGVSAGLGRLNVALVIVAAMVGAFLGDNLAYQIGQSAGPFLRRYLFRGAKGNKRLSWAEQQLQTRGGMLLITARFVPGGRTAITTVSGLTGQDRRRFVLFVGLASVIWATYATLLGYIGGKAFADNHTKAFVVAFGAALSVTFLIEIVRKIRHSGEAKGTAEAVSN